MTINIKCKSFPEIQISKNFQSDWHYNDLSSWMGEIAIRLSLAFLISFIRLSFGFFTFALLSVKPVLIDAKQAMAKFKRL